MKNIIVLIYLFGCFIISPLKGEEKKEIIKKTITEEMKLYPKEKLVDLYKSFFQGYWGPAHSVADSASALQYLQREINSMDKADTTFFYKVGYHNRYVRVNLLLVKEGIVPVKEFFHLFLNSVNKSNVNTLADWKKEWAMVINVIEEEGIHFADYDEDKMEIEKLLENGKYVMHHSTTFVNTYFPHYRLLSTEEFDKMKKQYHLEQ